MITDHNIHDYHQSIPDNGKYIKSQFINLQLPEYTPGGSTSPSLRGLNPASKAGGGAATWCIFRKLELYELALFNYGLMFGSLEWGVLQQMEITLDGLISDLGVFNYGFGCVSFCIMWCLSENRTLMMQKMVVFSSFSWFSIMNVQLLWNYCRINNWIDSICIGWIDLWFVCFQIWIFVYVTLQYVIFEWYMWYLKRKWHFFWCVFLYFDYSFMELLVTIIDLPLYTLILLVHVFFINFYIS